MNVNCNWGKKKKTTQSLSSAEILSEETKSWLGAGWALALGDLAVPFSVELSLCSQAVKIPQRKLLQCLGSVIFFDNVLGVRWETAYPYVNFHFTCLCSVQYSSLNCAGGLVWKLSLAVSPIFARVWEGCCVVVWSWGGGLGFNSL